jgi:hypothetical protein
MKLFCWILESSLGTCPVNKYNRSAWGENVVKKIKNSDLLVSNLLIGSTQNGAITGSTQNGAITGSTQNRDRQPLGVAYHLLSIEIFAFCR